MKIWDEKIIECAITVYVNIYALELMQVRLNVNT